MAAQTQSSLAWLAFSLLTVASWGVYGIFLHTGQLGMSDPVNGRYKAFLFVGIAYFLTAVVAPALMLFYQGATWAFPAKGAWWSLLAGIVGAIGAFGVLLAFGAKGSPAVVMSIVFAGAPVVNAIVGLLMHPPAGGWGSIKPQFYLGIAMAALGGTMVTYYKPAPTPPKPGAAGATKAAPAPTGGPSRFPRRTAPDGVRRIPECRPSGTRRFEPSRFAEGSCRARSRPARRPPGSRAAGARFERVLPEPVAARRLPGRSAVPRSVPVDVPVHPQA